MTDSNMSRRAVLKGALGATALGAGLGMSNSTLAKTAGKLEMKLSDPKFRAMARAKALGSIENELVYTFYRLHLYGYMNGGNLVPFFTMNNLNITRWTPLENGNYATSGAECGVYCKFDSDEVLDVWENPITGEKRKVWEFIGGPLKAEIGPDGMVTGGVAELSPEPLRMEVMGTKLFMPTQAAMAVPNPFDPEKWPKSSYEKKRHWDSHFVATAEVDEILNPNIARANSFLQFQNMGSWHPWLGLGQHAGRTYGKAYGTKLASLDDLPKHILKGIEAKTPEVFDFESWDKPRFEMLDYLQAHQPE